MGSLVDVVHGPGLHRPDDGLGLVVRGQDDDRQVGIEGLELCQHGQAVGAFAELEIEKDDIGVRRLGFCDRARGILCFRDLAVLAQGRSQDLAGVPIVVYDEYLEPFRRLGCLLFHVRLPNR